MRAASSFCYPRHVIAPKCSERIQQTINSSGLVKLFILSEGMAKERCNIVSRMRSRYISGILTGCNSDPWWLITAMSSSSVLALMLEARRRRDPWSRGGICLANQPLLLAYSYDTSRHRHGCMPLLPYHCARSAEFDLECGPAKLKSLRPVLFKLVFFLAGFSLGFSSSPTYKSTVLGHMTTLRAFCISAAFSRHSVLRKVSQRLSESPTLKGPLCQNGSATPDIICLSK